MTEPIPFAADALTSVVITATTPDAVVTSTVTLNSGFQALTHVGGRLSIDEFLALFDSGEAIAGVFVWDRGVQNWASWRPGLPTAL